MVKGKTSMVNMNIDNYMLNDKTIRKEKIINEMKEYLKTNPDKNTDEYKNKYNHYLSLIAILDNQDEEYLEDEIDVLKHHDNPYLKLKYWISSYTNYYYKIIKPEYFKITKKLKIDISTDNIENTIYELEQTINKLENEEKINYILNINEFINNNLK